MSVLRGSFSYARATIISGAVVVLVFGLFFRQSSTTWIVANDTVIPSFRSSDQPAMNRLVTEPKRKPIDPGEWARVFRQENVAEGLRR
jgi:hypothetical protein